MGSRLRDNPSRIIECFLEVVAPSEGNDPWILQKFPENFKNEEVLKCVGEFAYPCDTASSTVQHFSFVLTDVDSKWTYGFCRHAPNAPTCFCVLSHLPWHETFYKLLDRIAEITHRKEDSDLNSFLESVYSSDVPTPGTSLAVRYNEGKRLFEAHCPDHLKLPTLPEHRNLIEYYSAIDPHNMVTIFASMLNERRILVCSSRLSRLSACVQAASALIFPMHWQHIFIPVLPLRLIDYLSAPIPFLIGVPMKVFERVKRFEIGDAVILHADNNRIETPFDDLQNLPFDIVNNLKRKLKNPETMRGDGIARAFLDALVELIGGYRDALKFNGGQRITFCRETFLQTRPTHMQPYLERMLHLQIFQQFIEERLEMLNSGKGLNDIFEEEVSFYAGKSGAKFKMQYKEWMGNFKKESGALLRTVKSKAYPAVKQMKDRSRKAYKEVRSMFQDNFNKDSKYTTSATLDGVPQSSSAPSSPTLSRPTSIHGTRLQGTGNQRPIVSYVRQRDGPTRRTVNGRLESLRKFPNYTPLGVDAMSPDVSSMDNNRSPSPNLDVQRINMDLMGDLKEFIFRKCPSDDTDSDSLSSMNPGTSNVKVVPVIDRSLKPQQVSPVDSSLPTDDHWHILTPPLPPPRAKRSILHNIKTRDEEPKGATEDNQSVDISLIRLDSDDSDIVFDPLLATNGRDCSLDNLIQTNLNATTDLTMPSPISPILITSPNATATSPGLNNPVYFHVVPSAFDSKMSSQPYSALANGSDGMQQPHHLAIQHNINSVPNRYSFEGNIGGSSSIVSSMGNVCIGSKPSTNMMAFQSANLLNHNNNRSSPCNPPSSSRLLTPSPQLSYLHSESQSFAPSQTPLSPCQRAIVFDHLTNDFLVHETRSSSSTTSTTSADRNKWQTFE